MPPSRQLRQGHFEGAGREGTCAISALMTLSKSGQNMAGQDGCNGGRVGLRGRHRSQSIPNDNLVLVSQFGAMLNVIYSKSINYYTNTA